MITGPKDQLAHVSVSSGDDVEEIRQKITDAVSAAGGEEGTLLLVDMFGGTPSNMGISFLEKDRVEVVTGVNLPMLTKFVNLDPGLGLQEAAKLLRDHAREHIKVASEYLAEG
jgi:PTS system mannose-specific IIA component